MNSNGSVVSVTPKPQRKKGIYWPEFTGPFVDGMPAWKMVYSVIFAVFAIVANSLPVFFPSLGNMKHLTSGTIAFGILSSIYVLMSIASIPILWWSFQKAMKVPSYLSTISGQKLSLKNVFGYKTFRILFFYVFAPLIFLGLNTSYGELTSALVPHFAQSQHLAIGNNAAVQVVMACIASLEELWRWAMILSVLMIVKAVSKQKWEQSKSYRKNAMVIAFIVSSLFFGLGHVAEFPPRFKLLALLILGGSGVILGLATLLTRRLWIGVFAHGVYDGFGLTHTMGYVVLYIYASAAAGLLVILPVFWVFYKHIQKRTEGYNV